LRGKYFLPVKTGVRNVARYVIACAAALLFTRWLFYLALTLLVKLVVVVLQF
jgi:hypothetical protein